MNSKYGKFQFLEFIKTRRSSYTHFKIENETFTISYFINSVKMLLDNTLVISTYRYDFALMQKNQLKLIDVDKTFDFKNHLELTNDLKFLNTVITVAELRNLNSSIKK